MITSGVKYISESAFKGCKNLGSITLNEVLEEIGENTFKGCKNLHSLTLPKSVKKIKEKVLWNGVLTEIRVTDGNDFYYDGDEVLLSKPDVALVQYLAGKCEHYIVPENVTEVNDSAFCRAKSLESFTVKGSLTSIGRAAFYGCYSLKSVHIYREAESIDNSAFAFCEGLLILGYNGGRKFGEDVFFGCDKLNTTTT